MGPQPKSYGWQDLDVGRRGSPRSENGSLYSRSSRRHSAVRDDAQTEDEYFRKMRVTRYMEEEKERSERTKILSYEQERWSKLRVKERAERLRWMSGDEIADLMRREARERAAEERAGGAGRKPQGLQRHGAAPSAYPMASDADDGHFSGYRPPSSRASDPSSNRYRASPYPTQDRYQPSQTHHHPYPRDSAENLPKAPIRTPPPSTANAVGPKVSAPAVPSHRAGATAPQSAHQGAGSRHPAGPASYASPAGGAHKGGRDDQIHSLNAQLATLVACQDEQTALSTKQLVRDLVQERQQRRELERKVEKLQKNENSKNNTKEMTDIIRELKDQLQRADEEIARQRKAADAAQREKNQLLRTLEESRDQRRSNADQHRVADLENRIADLQHRIQDSDGTIRQLKATLQQLNEDIERRRRSEESSRREKEELQRALEESKANQQQNKGAQQRVAELAAEVSALHQKNQESASIIDDLNQDIAGLHNDVNHYRSAAERAEYEKQQLQRALEEQRKSEPSFKSDAGSEPYRIRIEELERREAEMRDMRREDARTINDLREALRHLEDEEAIADRSIRSGSNNPKDNDLQARLAEMRRMKEDDVATIHRLLRERDELREELERQKQQPRNNKAKEDRRAEISPEKLQELQDQIRDNKARVADAEERIRALRQKLKEINEKREEEEKARVRREAEEKRKAKKDVLPADEEWIEELQAVKQENKALKDENSYLKEDNNGLRRRVQELEAESNARTDDPAPGSSAAAEQLHSPSSSGADNVKAQEEDEEQPAPPSEQKEEAAVQEEQKEEAAPPNEEPAAAATPHSERYSTADQSVYPPGTLHAEEVVYPGGVLHSEEVVLPEGNQGDRSIHSGMRNGNTTPHNSNTVNNDGQSMNLSTPRSIRSIARSLRSAADNSVHENASRNESAGRQPSRAEDQVSEKANSCC